jgi:nicotinamidase-related amidase
LEHLGVKTLILTGFAGNICVLYTANDAYLRDYRLAIPSDCTASNTRRDNQYALGQMKRLLKADIRPSARLTFHRQRKRI